MFLRVLLKHLRGRNTRKEETRGETYNELLDHWKKANKRRTSLS